VALKMWADLEEKAPTPVERQTMRLHAANVLVKTGKFDHARALLETVDEPALQAQKQKLVAQLAETAKK
jgi:outer membrane PBP1 activator LpoA protein